MTPTRINCTEVEKNWRTILHQAHVGAQTFIIERTDQPAAVLLNYERWQALLRLEQDNKVAIGKKRLQEIEDQPIYTQKELETLLDMNEA